MDLSNFSLQGNNRQEAYEAHIAFEMGFSNPQVRDVVTFEEFCHELNLGYGNSDHTQIARLYETLDGKVYYDNEYCA